MFFFSLEQSENNFTMVFSYHLKMRHQFIYWKHLEGFMSYQGTYLGYDMGTQIILDLGKKIKMSLSYKSCFT